MRSHRFRQIAAFAAVVVAATLGQRPSVGYTPSTQVTGCDAKIQHLCDALRNTGAAASSGQSLGELIAAALESPDEELRKKTMVFLRDEVPLGAVDWRALRPSLERYDQLQTSSDCSDAECECTDGRDFAEFVEFKLSSRSEKVAFLARAMEEGEVRFRLFHSFHRSSAVSMVATDGLWELRSLYDKYCSERDPYGCKSGAILLDLREGSPDLPTGNAMAVRRLEKMDQESLFQTLMEQGMDTGCSDGGPWRLAWNALRNSVVNGRVGETCEGLQRLLDGFSARLSERRRQQLSTFRFTPQTLAPPVEPEPEKQMRQWVNREIEALRPCLPLKGPDR
ncbi:MAG TPA: hypothetical protein P5234_00010 [Thermoanaerobaculaceae bacterium]|nr:hypothetical protein [Thermoanaerobaculaceae bacterium]HRS14612.1 hypothetical protein [Thermoanaerobaculaceae bacterium]